MSKKRKFWSLVYSTVPKKRVRDGHLLANMLRRLDEKGTHYRHVCCTNEHEEEENPENFVAFLNQRFPESPVCYELVDQREITEAEYVRQREDRDRQALRNVERHLMGIAASS